MKKIEKHNPLPMYFQIKEILKELIENEELKPGDMIPPEREICSIQQVSRMTVNKAIMSLVNEGILYREQGKGTFVSKPKKKQVLTKLKGFTEEMLDRGLRTETKIISFTVNEVTKQIKSILEMPDSETKVIQITRLRIFNGEPMGIEIVWLPYNLFPNMTEEMVSGQSLYGIFKEKYNYQPKKAKQTIEPIILNDYECDLLNQKKGSVAMLFWRNTYTAEGIQIEYNKSIYRSDIYKYEIIIEDNQ
ncbi:GntR family transcriptional regulator [Clostridium akagii]|uniref:GntR family transcriptional regulator n=1 Tax=Clostridium akagii TaxID=91623 RepID=UPI00047E2941|nr:GntR family transcriptional regulator [Clostridium akagii]